jgi:hypothetical protein
VSGTVACETCGVEQRIFTSVNVDGVLLIPAHRCERYLMAEYWHNGKRLAVESSEFPGVAGRQHLVRAFRQQAVDGWLPPAGRQGWVAWWVSYSSEDAA